MLRVVIEQLAGTYRVGLHGTLGGEWVPLVEQHWRSIVNGHRVSPGITLVLSDVDYIDGDGARLLRRMADAGVEFVVAGCMNRYLIETLQPDGRTAEGERTMATKTITSAPDLKAYEDRIVAKIHDVNARLEQFEAAAHARRGQAEIAAINGLKTARASIEQKLKDLQTAQAAHVAKAKAEIDAAVIGFEKALEDFRQKYTAPAGKEH